VVVEEAEGLRVAGAGELDQGDQPGALGLVLLRGGGQVGVTEASGPTGRTPGGEGPTEAVTGQRLAEQDVETACQEGLRDADQTRQDRTQGIKPSRDVQTVRRRAYSNPPAYFSPKPSRS
jgi:hypothetical protein